MAEELLIGGALGALMGELLRVVRDLSSRTIHFKSVLLKITSHLEFLSQVMKQLDELSDFLNFPQNTNNLRALIRAGSELIAKCEALKQSILKYPKAPFYTKRLQILDADLHRASHHLSLQLLVEQIKKQALGSHICGYGFFHKIIHMINQNVWSKFVGNRERGIGNDAYAHPSLPFKFYELEQLKGPNFGDRLLGVAVEYLKDDSKEGGGKRIEEKVKEFGEDRYEKNFQRSFETVDGEKLQNWFRCHFIDTVHSDLNGPIKGILYVSTQKLAFCSTKRIRHAELEEPYLKVVTPFELIKGVVIDNPYDEECIKFISVDNQELKFINFRNYNDAKKCMQKQVYVTPATCNCVNCNT